MERAADTSLVTLSAIGKSYPVATTAMGRVRTLYSLLRGRPFAERYDALADIDLEVRRGESLGLIGVNGAGKSTLLKIIAGVVKPTTGTVVVQGQFSALLELGAGFHPEYTGRQNVFLAAALKGMNEAETRERLADIVAFADIGDHIDQPIKHYSSGMVVRLGFAVATAMRPDLLITDEVLAVGDESFQRKCITWIERYLADGGTLLLCAHSMFHIQKLCQKAAWIHGGRLRSYGDSNRVTREYLAWHDAQNAPKAQEHQQAIRAGTYALLSLSFNERPSAEGVTIPMGGALRVAGRVFSPDGRTPTVIVGLVRKDGMPVYGVSSRMDDYAPTPVGEHEFAFEYEIPELALLPGEYTIKGHALDPEEYRLFDEITGDLVVTGTSRELGVCRLTHRWNPV
jgi:lipopolysaccharide transport system ATP-binding protein